MSMQTEDYMASRYAPKRPRAKRVAAVVSAPTVEGPAPENADPENPRAVFGNNSGPTPFELSECEIGDLYVEAKNWLDGKPITTQAEADEVGKLLDLARKAEATADARRKAENEPFDSGKTEVQNRYNPLIQKDKGKTAKIATGCKVALAKWLIIVEEEKAKIAAAARAEADEKAQLAKQLFAASESTNLAAREIAEELADDAKDAEKWAKRAEKDTASVKGGSRAITLRSVWTPALADVADAANHYFERRPTEFAAFLLSLAAADVKTGARTIPGFIITESKVAV